MQAPPCSSAVGHADLAPHRRLPRPHFAHSWVGSAPLSSGAQYNGVWVCGRHFQQLGQTRVGVPVPGGNVRYVGYVLHAQDTDHARQHVHRAGRLEHGPRRREFRVRASSSCLQRPVCKRPASSSTSSPRPSRPPLPHCRPSCVHAVTAWPVTWGPVRVPG